MTKAMMKQLTAAIIDTVSREDGGNGTAPVTLQIGYVTNNICCDDGILVTNAPPAVVDAVMTWVEDYRENGMTGMQRIVTVSASHGGLLVQ